MITRRTAQLAVATVCAVCFPALGGLVFLAHEGVKKLFLKSAGFVVGGVKDNIGGVAVVSIVVLLLAWGAIIAGSLYEGKAEAAKRGESGNP